MILFSYFKVLGIKNKKISYKKPFNDVSYFYEVLTLPYNGKKR